MITVINFVKVPQHKTEPAICTIHNDAFCTIFFTISAKLAYDMKREKHIIQVMEGNKTVKVSDKVELLRIDYKLLQLSNVSKKWRIFQ